MPAHRFHFTYEGEGEGGARRSGFYYVIARDAPARHMLVIAGDAPADRLDAMEAAALSTRPAGR